MSFYTSKTKQPPFTLRLGTYNRILKFCYSLISNVQTNLHHTKTELNSHTLLLFSSIPKCKVSHDFERLNSHCWKLDRATSCNVTLYYYLFNAILVFIVLFYALLFLKNWERTSK